ncbi:Arrestin domain containing protein [Aphelenchoides fujianensis]|nr:Arrestin domain containing protein [Aphelenchoides fujianensis]
MQFPLKCLSIPQRVLTGSELKASIVLDVVEEPGVVLRELVAEVRGVGRTNWVDLCSDKIYDANQDYIRHVISLAPPGTTLLSGRHQYPIQVPLPKDLPSSYESACGSVRYSFRVTMNVQGEKISVPRLAYQLGETITPLVHVKNSCAHDVQYKAVSRYEHVEEKKLVEERVCESWLGRIKSQSEMTSFKCRLRAPEDIPPSTMNTGGRRAGGRGRADRRLVEMPVIVTALGFERDAAAALKQKAARDVGLQRSQTTDV